MTGGRDFATTGYRLLTTDYEGLTNELKSFDYIRIPDSAFPIPPAQDETLDIVVLDMNHGWPNIGHHALVDAVRELTEKFFADLENPPLSVRVFSFDVRQG